MTIEPPVRAALVAALAVSTIWGVTASSGRSRRASEITTFDPAKPPLPGATYGSFSGACHSRAMRSTIA
jgi:hypothetical protein